MHAIGEVELVDRQAHLGTGETDVVVPQASVVAHETDFGADTPPVAFQRGCTHDPGARRGANHSTACGDAYRTALHGGIDNATPYDGARHAAPRHVTHHPAR